MATAGPTASERRRSGRGRWREIARALPCATVSMLVAACHLGPGPFRLPAVEGRVVDSETGAGVGGAEVFEWYHGAGRMGEPPPVQYGRWAQSDAAGRFALASAWSTSWRMWLLRSDGPTYSTYHPDYGLVHQGPGRPSETGELELRVSRSGRETGLAALGPTCLGELDDAASRHLAEIACGRAGAPAPRRERPVQTID